MVAPLLYHGHAQPRALAVTDDADELALRRFESAGEGGGIQEFKERFAVCRVNKLRCGSGGSALVHVLKQAIGNIGWGFEQLERAIGKVYQRDPNRSFGGSLVHVEHHETPYGCRGLVRANNEANNQGKSRVCNINNVERG